MYDYVDGKVDWMGFGLPVEGDDGPFLGSQVVPVPTCDVGQTVADARRALKVAGDNAVVVVEAEGLAVGDVDGEALAGQPDETVLLEVLRPVPSTVRPSVTVASVSGGGAPLVTTSDGRLLGRASVDAAPGDEGHDHEGHDDEGHDHDGPAFDLDGYESELTAVLTAVEEHFGDAEPSPEELRAFLHDRLVAEGRSAEEVDQLLDSLAADEPG